MRDKKSGSSLVVVTIVMGILFTIGTAVLGLTASNYKVRINESKRIENLYASDSGLDVTYNIIAKTSQAAIKNSIVELSEQINIQLKNEEEAKSEINVMFKENFINFLGEDETGVLGQAIIHNQIPNLRGDLKGIDSWEQIDKKSTISIEEYRCEDNTITVVIESAFKTESIDNTKLKNEKKIKTTYVVSAPDYKDNIMTESEVVTVNIYPVFNGKIITADGNLKINGSIDFKGDIWVKGNDDGPIVDLSYDKYKEGILINNGQVELDGNIYTSKTLNLTDKSKLNLNEDIYAFNTYLGRTARGTLDGTNIKLKADDMVLINDLTLNTNLNNEDSLDKSQVDLNNFYGIDKVVENPTTANMALESSSIIVNDFGSTLNIKDSAYISGVAYIDTNKGEENGDKYQTGESVAVKGNYKAYTEVLPGYEDKVTINYYNPLQLIETIENDGSVSAKGEYFIKYYEKNSTLNSAGITLPKNTYASGVYVSNGEVGKNSISTENQKLLNDKKDDYDKYVVHMGLKDEENKNVINKINWAEIERVNTELLNYQYGKVILNNNENEKIVIRNNIYKGETLDKVLIISKGDVLLEGNINLTGNIISAKNVEIKASKNENFLNYNYEDTLKMIAANYDALKNLFVGVTLNSQTVNVGNKVVINSDSNGYEVKSYLTTKNWRILK